MSSFPKKIIRPFWRYAYQKWSIYNTKRKTFHAPIHKLLQGGNNGIRAAKYAELTQKFLLPSTSVVEGGHVKLLQLYEQVGNEVLQDDVFQSTEYYKNALECMNLTGGYFYDRPEKIKIVAERFIRQHKGEQLNLPRQPGQSDANQPIWVRPIKHSSCYEVIDGNHRIARAIMRGETLIPALIYEKEPTYTPLQQLLLDCLWINKQNWLYQPVEAPELQDEWKLVRKCTDRLELMKTFLTEQGLLENNQKKPGTFIDIGSSYGWFVKKMEELGFDAYGMDRDPFSLEVGFKVYGLKKEKIFHIDITRGLEDLVVKNKKYDVVSCLSVLHHFVLGKSSISAEDFVKLIDRVTGKVLFLDTGEEHETAFEGALAGWNPSYITEWLQANTSFSRIIPLGVDQDRQTPFENYYNRTLFECMRA